jgi:hypothetical protein
MQRSPVISSEAKQSPLKGSLEDQYRDAEKQKDQKPEQGPLDQPPKGFAFIFVHAYTRLPELFKLVPFDYDPPMRITLLFAQMLRRFEN